MCKVYIVGCCYGGLVVKKMSTEKIENPTHEGSFMGALTPQDSLRGDNRILEKLLREVLERITHVNELMVLVYILYGGVN
jgi:hypothetical protein